MADLLSSVIAAHGGLDRWRTVRAIDVTFNFSGGLLDLKGYPGHRRPSASVDTATPRTVFQRLGYDAMSAQPAKVRQTGGRPVHLRRMAPGRQHDSTHSSLGNLTPVEFARGRVA